MITTIILFRKFKADKIFTGYSFINGDKALVTATDGTVIDIIDGADAGDTEYFSGILSPGFVNAHCHLELSHMKGLIPEKTGLVDFVYKVVNERQGAGEKPFTVEELEEAVINGENEMLLNGIVAVGDICNNALTLQQKKQQNLHYYNFIEASGWLPSVSQSRFQRAVEIFQQFKTLEDIETGIPIAIGRQLATGNWPPDSYREAIGNSIVPHAPYSVSEKLWQLIIPYFKGKVVSIHNQETSFEDELFQAGTGDFIRMFEMMKIDNAHHLPSNKSSLQTYFPMLSGAASVILVHNTFTRQEDIDFTRNADQLTSFCICINANRYIEDAMPPVEMLQRNNCNIVLGTDSLASNRSLSILDEMRSIEKYFPAITLENMLQWATINGSRALMMDKELGSFEKGKKPGVILIEDIQEEKIAKAAVKKIL
jgi:cytosine/adenosine deaminase-related metal-dependent hydrolase